MTLDWSWALPALVLLPLLVWLHVRRRRPVRRVVPSLLPFEDPSVASRPPRPRRLADLSLLLQCLVVLCCAAGLGGASCSGSAEPVVDVVLDRSVSMVERRADALDGVGRALVDALPGDGRVRIWPLDAPEVPDPVVVGPAELASADTPDTWPAAPPSDGLPGSLAPHLARGRPFVLVTDRDLPDLPGVLIWSAGTPEVDGALVGVFEGSDDEPLLRVRLRGAPEAVAVSVGGRPLSVPPRGEVEFVDLSLARPTEPVDVVLRLGTAVAERARLLPADPPPRVLVGPDVGETLVRALRVAGAVPVAQGEPADLLVRQGGRLVGGDELPALHVAPVADDGPSAGVRVEPAPVASVDGRDVVAAADAPALPDVAGRLALSATLDGGTPVWDAHPPDDSDGRPGLGLVRRTPRSYVVAVEPDVRWAADPSFPAMVAHALDVLVPERRRSLRLEATAPLSERLPPAAEARPVTSARLAEVVREDTRRRESTAPFWAAAALLVALLAVEWPVGARPR